MELELERDGWQWRIVPLQAGAAQDGCTYEPPQAVRVRPVLLTLSLVTDANVGNRVPVVQLFGPAGRPLGLVPAPATLAATHTAVYTFGVGLVAQGAANAEVFTAPLPELELGIGCGLRAAVLGFGAGDTIQDATLYLAQRPTAWQE